MELVYVDINWMFKTANIISVLCYIWVGLVVMKLFEWALIVYFTRLIQSGLH